LQEVSSTNIIQWGELSDGLPHLEHLKLTSNCADMNSSTLLQTLSNTEEALIQARAAIINEIIARLGDCTPSQFAAATGINRGNLYALLRGKWNAVIAVQCLLASDGMPADVEPPTPKRELKKYNKRSELAPRRLIKEPPKPAPQPPIEVAS